MKGQIILSMKSNRTSIQFAADLVLLSALSVLLAACDDKSPSHTSTVHVDRQTVRTNSTLRVRKPAMTRLSSSNDTDGAPLTFHGYVCTQDCSGHEAGYQWAEDHDIDDPEDCGGNSESFIEGCRAYAEEQGNDTDEADREE